MVNEQENSVFYTILTLLTSIFNLVAIPFLCFFKLSTTKGDEVKVERLQSINNITLKTSVPKSNIQQIIDQKNINTLADLLNYTCKVNSSKKCIGTRKIINHEYEIEDVMATVNKRLIMGEYNWQSYAEINDLAKNFGKTILELGVKPEEKVIIFAETRSEWMIAAQGLFKQNIILVAVYPTFNEEEILKIVNETNAKIIITSFDLMAKIKKILLNTTTITTVIYFEHYKEELDVKGFKKGVDLIKFREILKKGATLKKDDNLPKLDSIAMILYTNSLKSVKISHKTMISTLKSLSGLINLGNNEIHLAMLPLCNIFEFLMQTLVLLLGSSIGYSSKSTIFNTSSLIRTGTKGDIEVLKPTLLTCDPEMISDISKLIQLKYNSQFITTFYDFFYNYKVEWNRRGYKTPFTDMIIFAPLRKILGGQMKLILSSGALLSGIIQERLSNLLTLRVLQGYYTTEGSFVAIADSNSKFCDNVGFSCMDELKLVNYDEGGYRINDIPNARGEICIKNDDFYYKKPSKEKENLIEIDGKNWLKTGDIAEINKQGIIKIMDNKKNIIRLENGNNLLLGKIESHLITNPLIDNICVCFESNKQQCVALIVPNPANLKKLLVKSERNKRIALDEMCDSKELQQIVQNELTEYAKQMGLQTYEIPRKIKLVKEVWTTDNKFLTSKLTLNRDAIVMHYKNEIKNLSL